MACEEEPNLPDEKLFMCTQCARSMKLQELFYKDNNCRIYQTIISEFNKTQDYSEVYIIVIPHYFGCELDSV